MNPVRIGIDVGGTFTHAVALDGLSLELLAKVKVPTSHQAKEGVAKGIIDSLRLLLDTADIDPARVNFIAHSTTQATNALLEGDVAPVGIIGMGGGASAWLARNSTKLAPIELARGKFLKTTYRFIDTAKGLDKNQLKETFVSLAEEGAMAFAISEAYSVDRPENEAAALSIAQELGFLATSGSEVSKLYGLTVRTRTAVINAAMLPKMLETANMTEESVRAAGIKAPIMIMRSDGGVMDIESMRRRPILTRLSGPAAGVAAAMMYLRISDGIFLEVGGTSTDISVIKNGKALVKDAEIGGHRLYLKSLDVNTLGIAGGSMLRVNGAKIVDIGPRSAHIAGLSYASFSKTPSNPQLKFVQPRPEDPADYLAIADDQGVAKLTVTPTCASNLLNLVPDSDPAFAKEGYVQEAFQFMAGKLNLDPRSLASDIMETAFSKVQPALAKFIKEYKLDPDNLSLVGGGGGAAAIVPFVANKLGLPFTLSKNADVVSAIGVALALVREMVERQVLDPKPEDLLRIREEALASVVKMGADPKTVEVNVEIDSRTNIIRATAFGSTQSSEAQIEGAILGENERQQVVISSFRRLTGPVETCAKSDHFEVFSCKVKESRLFGLLSSMHNALRVLDSRGVIRLKISDGVARQAKVAETEGLIKDLAESYATFGDAGKIIPDFMLLAGPRIIDLSGMADTWQVQTLAKSELGSMHPDSTAIVLASLPR